MDGLGKGSLYTSPNRYSAGFPKLPPYPSPISRPPLSDLDKLYLDQTDHSAAAKQAAQIGSGGFGNFSQLPGLFPGHASGSHQPSPWLQQPSICSFGESSSFGAASGSLLPGDMISFGVDSEADLDSEGGKLGKGVPAPFLIKGQWSEEEDRKLMLMTEQHGYRKWAQIADHLTGRTGKQCRERWQNHLRPDIKKDQWNEMEERILVRAHEEFGNKWAEIAKRIPGRTENSIKNHWNATKRRQISKRKGNKTVERKISSSIPKSLVLQEYIETKNFYEGDIILATRSSSTTTTPASSVVTEELEDPLTYEEYWSDDVESPLMMQYQFPSCDEEISYMQDFFLSAQTQAYNLAEKARLEAESIPMPELAVADQLITEPPYQGFGSGFSSFNEKPVYPAPQEEMIMINSGPVAPLASDLYVSQLLDGTSFFGGADSSKTVFGDQQDELLFDHGNEVPMSPPRKDVDLMEMMFPSSFGM